jgi:hypothetical protein
MRSDAFKNIVDDEPDWPLRRRGFTIRRRAVVRRMCRSVIRCSDIFHFVEIASTRTRMVLAAKKSQAASS